MERERVWLAEGGRVGGGGHHRDEYDHHYDHHDDHGVHDHHDHCDHHWDEYDDHGHVEC